MKASSDLLLLDVNVLLALVWPNHQFHTAATQRLESSHQGWATCALTQLDFIRISSNPAALATAKTPAECSETPGGDGSRSVAYLLEITPRPPGWAIDPGFRKSSGEQTSYRCLPNEPGTLA